MGAVLGKDFKLYYDTDLPYDGSPVYTEVTNVRDLTRNLEKALADASIRGSSYRLQLGTLKDLSIDFQMVYDPSDAAFTAFENAFFDDSSIWFAILDGSKNTVGSKGVAFMGQITSFTINEALEDVGLVDITVVPAYDASNLPRQVVVNSPGVISNA